MPLPQVSSYKSSTQLISRSSHLSQPYRLEELELDIFKVVFENQIFCMKTVHRTGNELDFIREVSVLQRCSHPNIITLVGVVIHDDAAAEGMLIEYIPSAKSLKEREIITIEEFEKWKK